MDNKELNMLIDVSTRYYLKEQTQQQIADELYLSRPKVSRLLKKAREEGVVSIRINYSTDNITNLRQRILNEFPVKKVYISQSLSTEEKTLNEICKLAAEVIYDNLHDGCSLAISWGRSVRKTIKHLRKKKLDDTSVVEMFGSVSYEFEDSNSNRIGSELSEKIGATFFPIPAPLFVKSMELKKALTDTPIIKTSLDKLKEVDFLITGLSSINTINYHSIWDVYMEKNIKETIEDSGAKGFICAKFFDDDGKFLDIEVNKQVIGIDDKDIKDKNLICISGGKNKVDAIRIALKSGIIDTIISDELTLEKVLKG